MEKRTPKTSGTPSGPRPKDRRDEFAFAPSEAPEDSELRPESDTIRIETFPRGARKPTGADSGVDPYSTSDRRAVPKPPRRTLDDMRRLNEEIKRARRKDR